jgi:5-(carboxyamino)imidazole ribonucleotide mutase
MVEGDRKAPTESEEFDKSPLVGVVMGSDSDLPTMAEAMRILKELGVPFEEGIKSAHRTPQRMIEYAQTAYDRGLKVIIAGAGGAAHLPGMIASETIVPVIGVPIKTSTLSGVDSLYSIVQMPPGIPVGTMSIGGAKNAGLYAAEMLAMNDPALAQRLVEYKANLASEVAAKDDRLDEIGFEAYLAQMN